jgi:hypothetical protein
MKHALLASALLAAFASADILADSATRVGQIEIVAELPITPGNITATADGRMFATVHGMRRGPAQLIEIFPGNNRWAPFPDTAWNAVPGSGPDVLNSAHGILVDSHNRLWVTDHGNWMPDGKARQPKLVAFDIATREVVFRHDFAPDVGPVGGIMQDIAVDAERGFVYIADCGANPAIVIVDIHRNTAWKWSDHPSLAAENVDLVVEGQRLLFPRPDGSMAPARVPVNPISLSADGETLFFGAMNGERWYGLPAALLRERADAQRIGGAVRVVGNKPVSDGISTDAAGNHFITNLRDNAIDKLGADGRLSRLVKDDRFLWPDNVRFGPHSWLYVAVNQLHRNPIFTGKPDNGQPPYLIARVWTGTPGQPGR